MWLRKKWVAYGRMDASDCIKVVFRERTSRGCTVQTFSNAVLATDGLSGVERSTHLRLRLLLDAPWPQEGALCLETFFLRARLVLRVCRRPRSSHLDVGEDVRASNSCNTLYCCY